MYLLGPFSPAVLKLTKVTCKQLVKQGQRTGNSDPGADTVCMHLITLLNILEVSNECFIIVRPITIFIRFYIDSPMQ